MSTRGPRPPEGRPLVRRETRRRPRPSTPALPHQEARCQLCQGHHMSRRSKRTSRPASTPFDEGADMRAPLIGTSGSRTRSTAKKGRSIRSVRSLSLGSSLLRWYADATEDRGGTRDPDRSCSCPRTRPSAPRRAVLVRDAGPRRVATTTAGPGVRTATAPGAPTARQTCRTARGAPRRPPADRTRPGAPDAAGATRAARVPGGGAATPIEVEDARAEETTAAARRRRLGRGATDPRAPRVRGGEVQQ